MSIRGAEFRKSDFQIHSPRDAGWDGIRPEDSIEGNPTEAKVDAVRMEWAKRLVETCVAAGLQAISLTDHHEGVYAYAVIKYLKSMAPSPDFWVFPGMELTLKDSCQALIIFDADFPQVLFEKARGRLGLPADVKPLEPKGIAVDLLNHNIEDIQGVLGSDEELQGKFIVLPHVKPGGHKTVLRQGFHKRFKDMPYVGGYMDRQYVKELDAGDQRILMGEIPAWSADRRGVISTSDSRFSDFRLIGQHAAWIKLAQPTAESLRQAMLAADSRLAEDEPNLPRAVIESVEVIGSNYLKPTAFTFNQQLNTVIGGRGAGKSSLLEYIRFGLGCSAIDLPNESDHAARRMAEMLRATLPEAMGTIKVSVRLNGALVMLSRSMANRDLITISANGEESQSSPRDVRSLVPVQSFRQGELSDLAGEQAAERLMELVTADERENIRRVEDELKSIAGQVSETLSMVTRLIGSRAKQSAIDTEAKLVRQQIESIQSQIVSPDPESKNILADHEKYNHENGKIDRLSDSLVQTEESIRSAFSKAIQSVETFRDERSGLDLISLASIYSFADALVQPADASNATIPLEALSASASSRLKAILEELSALKQVWADSLREHREKYKAQSSLLTGQQVKLDELKRLTERLQLLNQTSDEVLRELGELSGSEVKLSDLRKKYVALQDELTAIVTNQVERISTASAGLARGQVSQRKRLDELRVALNAILSLPHIRESRIEAVLNSVGDSADSRDTWNAVVSELYSLLMWKVGNSANRGATPETPILLNTLEANFLERLISHIEVEHVAQAMRVVFRPVVDIYQIRGTAEVEFSKASQGEQAAALLNILMNQAAGPLLIDQPEADLDNRIINEIIKTIRRTKDDRQLILATHSANITVNGDSELVTELRIGEKCVSGAIDEPDVRGAITDTMEGGKDAFELRRRKYNF